MRIVSLLPSATEIVASLGLGDQLVGVSHACDFPADVVADKPVLTTSESPTTPDTERLRELRPDLLLAAPGVDDLGPETTVLRLDPRTLADVLESIRAIGRAAGRETEADALAESVQTRLDRVREVTAEASPRPKTLLLAGTAPPLPTGRWNPELLERAGGVLAPWDTPGEPPRTLTWGEVRAFVPAMLVLVIAGLDADQVLTEAKALTSVPGWFDLPAVRDGECYAVDGKAYFHRPGPRLAESAEILATVLHPELFTEMLPPYSVRRFPNELLEPEDNGDDEEAK